MTYTDPQFDPEDFENLVERSRNVPVRQIKAWEQQTKRLAELEAREAARDRTAALTEAGIPAEFAGLFRDDAPVDSLKAAFEKFGGASGTPQANAQQQARQQALAGHQAAADMGSGAANADQSGLGSFLDTQMQEAKARTDWRGGARKENAQLNTALAREGVSPQVTGHDWLLPGQLVSG
jgi:hypothetical protein